MKYIAALLLIISIFSCKPESYTPKPRGYYLIDLPEKSYQRFSRADFPYSFDYPIYGKISNDTGTAMLRPENPYWINVDFPALGGRIYLSYKTIGPNQTLDKLIEDVYEMTYKAHDKKADYIQPFTFHIDSSHVHGMLYNVEGNAASAYQFFATDSVKHFLRGALYFEASPNADSLKPVNDFLSVDIERLIQTIRWK